MNNPFDTLVSVAEFKTFSGGDLNQATDPEVTKFMLNAAKVLWKAGLSHNLKAIPKSIEEEVVVRRIGRAISSADPYGHDYEGFGYCYIQTLQPVFEVTEIGIKNQSVNPAVYSLIPSTQLSYQRFGKSIENAAGDISEGQIVRILYTTGITNSASLASVKADILLILDYLWSSNGKELTVGNPLGDRSLSEFKSDDTSYKYANPSGATVEEYFDENPYILSILAKYQPKRERHFF